MLEVLRENSYYAVELEKDDFEEHQPHKSWGTYRVVDRRNTRALFTTQNRDKSLGVFEYLTLGARPV
jgi:hypothetical protein